MSIYRPPLYANLLNFFVEITLSINKAALNYENLIVMGDFHIDINSSGVEKNKLEEFCNLFDLTNLIHGNTCCTKNNKSTIDLSLTNRPLPFQDTSTAETILSYYHKCSQL